MAIETIKHIVKDVRYEKIRSLTTGELVPYRAIQTIYVTGLTTGSGAKAVEQAEAAALACDSESEVGSPSLSNLVIDGVQAVRIEDANSAWVYVRWINPSLVNFSGGVVDQNLESAFDGGIIAVPWVQLSANAGSTTSSFSGTRPNGTSFHGMKSPSVKTDEDDVPTPYYRQVPVVHIRVPFSRSANPIGVVASLQGHVNADAVTWGGYAFPVRTLRFDKVAVRKYSGGSTDTFVGFYAFTARPDAWDQQDVEYTGGTWTTYIRAQHPSATFAGAFPAS